MTDVQQLGLEPVDQKKADPEDITLWSVTTIIGCLDKPALVYWSAEQTALAAVHQAKTWQAIADSSGDQEAVEWLKQARFKRGRGQRSAADLGTAVHAACEEYALTGRRPEVDDEVAPFLDQFDRWLDRWQPEYHATEVTVYSPSYGYAGCCDGFLSVVDRDGQNVRLIIDYKTSREAYDKQGRAKGPYPEVGLQLAAYRYAEMAAVWRPRRMEQFRRRYYLLSAEEQAAAVPVPEVDGGAVIYLTPDFAEMYPIRCDEAVHERFLFVLEAARWQFEMSKDVIGAAMQPQPSRPIAPPHIAALVD